MSFLFLLKKIIIGGITSFIIMILCTVSSSANNPSTPVIHLLNQGDIQGYYSDDLAIFKGIPYAAPPINAYRWYAPQPVVPWQGIRQTVAFAPNCQQSPNRWDNQKTFKQNSEDCLYLNIWAPRSYFDHPSDKKYPVIIWIHGGAYVSGGSSLDMYDGSQLAQQGVVVVSLNYRLGRFGFFAHPALKQENEENKWANYGILDQIAALQWIQQNINNFGGDNQNITLMGESAGGASIITLMTLKEAKGLFNKAIIQSGTGHSNFFPFTPLDKAEQIGLNFANRHHISNDKDSLTKLRSLPADLIDDQLSMQNLQPDYFSGVIIDGILIKQTLNQAFSKKEFYPVPVLIGDNEGDGVMLTPTTLSSMAQHLETTPEEINKVYNPGGKQSETKTLRQLIADVQYLEPTYVLAQQLAQANVPVYRYRFSYVATAARPYTSFGAPHASEIPFIFDTLDTVFPSITPQDQAMAKATTSYWLAFVKNNRPEVEGFPDFPSFNQYPDKLLNFTTKGIFFENDPFHDRIKFIQQLLEKKNIPPSSTYPTR